MVALVGNEVAETYQALIEAAGEVFAEVGYRAATVREICHRAGANIAAVNYHFGDKQQLYIEVLRYAQSRAMARYPTDLGLKSDAPPDLRLKAFIRAFLLRIFDEGPIAWHGKLMSREMIDPTSALDALVEEKIRPQARQLTGIVRQLLGRKASEKQVRWCALSIVSQCLFYHHCRPVLVRLYADQEFAADIEPLAEHIAAFSLGALRQFSKGKK
jgi:AcrR family transcriptional regulator